MDSKGIQQTLTRLRPGALVILNLGLGDRYGKGEDRTMASRLVTYTSNLRSLLKPGYAAEVQLAKSEDDEATLVVFGYFADDVCDTDRMWYMLQLAGQDCCSLWYPEVGIGHLFGSNVEEWEPFDPALFKSPTIRAVVPMH